MLLQVSSVKTGAANGFTLDRDRRHAHDVVGRAGRRGHRRRSGRPAATRSPARPTPSPRSSPASPSPRARSPPTSRSPSTSDEQSISDKVAGARQRGLRRGEHGVQRDGTGRGAAGPRRCHVDRSRRCRAPSATAPRPATSLKTYGIDLDSSGNLTFDASAFAAAYAADPAGTQTAIANSFAARARTRPRPTRSTRPPARSPRRSPPPMHHDDQPEQADRRLDDAAGDHPDQPAGEVRRDGDRACPTAVATDVSDVDVQQHELVEQQ